MSLAFLAAILCLAMVLPHLPGRFDGSATALAFAARVAGHASLLWVPVGVAWWVCPLRSSRWDRVALGVVGLVAFIGVFAALMNQPAAGALLGALAFVLLRSAWRRSRDVAFAKNGRSPFALALALVCVPPVLVAFQAVLLPRAADFSRERAIRHAAPMIAEIEAFHQRCGHYPVSLQSLNRDFPTGVVGVERFRYEPNGASYNLYFVRPHLALDAMEVVMFNPRDEHRFTSHELDILQFDGADLDLRRGDRRRTPLAAPHWVSILFD